MDMKDMTAIVGIGWTKYSKNSGVSTLTLALEASRNAIEDAGLTTKDIDGVVTYYLNDSCNIKAVATHLGIPIVRYSGDYTRGGEICCAVISHAAMAVAMGQANYVLIFRSMNGSSGMRYNSAANLAMLSTTGCGSDSEAQFMHPYGIVLPVHHFALLARRHIIKYGTPTSDQLGAFCIICRKHANLNERAQMYSRTLTKEDYMNSRMIAEPLRLYDCCLMSDGACAIIVTTADRARNLRRRPVYIMAAAEGGGPYTEGQIWGNYAPDHTVSYAHYIAPELYRRAGVGPKDIDVAEIYDCFSYSAINQIEDYGFCEKGEGGPFVQEGRVALGGDIPVNTHGGLLSEAYIHGLNSVIEAVIQLRGDAGIRQVKDAEIALVTAGGTDIFGSALILRR